MKCQRLQILVILVIYKYVCLSPQTKLSVGFNLSLFRKQCTLRENVDIGNLYGDMHMSMHVLNQQGSVSPPRGLSVGVYYTWHDEIGGHEDDWGSKALGSIISGFVQ